MNPEKKLDKYVRDLETQNVTALAKFMSNKRYFHKFYQLQDMNRVSLMRPDGKFNDKAFELINSNSEFQTAVNSTLKIAPGYQAALNQTERDPTRKHEHKVLQESQRRFKNIWKARKDRAQQQSMDGIMHGDPYSKTSPFMSRDFAMQNITSNQSLVSGSDAAAYRSHQNVGLPSIHRVAAGAASNMVEIKEEGSPYDSLAAYHEMNQDYLD